MTDFNKPRPTPEDEAFNDIERQSHQRKAAVIVALENAEMRFTEFKKRFDALSANRNSVIEEVALHIEKLKGFGKDTTDSLAVYIREMKTTGREPTSELHSCPYAEEIHGNYEKVCDCDEETTRQCAQNI